MPQQIYRIVSVAKYESNSIEIHVFKGTMEDILYKFGAQNNNPLVGYISKGIHFVYKFYSWNGESWELVSDPRPEAMGRKIGANGNDKAFQGNNKS